MGVVEVITANTRLHPLPATIRNATSWRTRSASSSDSAGQRTSPRSDQPGNLLDVNDLLFEIATPLGFTVRCSRAYWEHVLLEKHPVLRGRENDVKAALADPDEVRRSRKDTSVLLFYAGGSPRWTCAVTKADGTDGFLVTA